MPFDPHLNLRRATVAIAPSPAISGTGLTLDNGTVFPATSLGAYNLIVWPNGEEPTTANAEIIRVTTRTGNVLSPIVRAQEGSAARSIVIGDQVALVPTAKTFTDIEAAIATTVRVVEGAAYPRTRAGIAAAVALGAGTVYIPPGSDILWDTTTVVYTGDDLWVNWDPSVRLNFPATAASVCAFRFNGAGAGASAVLSGNAAEGLGYCPVSTANVNALVAGGLVDGSTVFIYQTVVDGTDPGSDCFTARVTSINAAGGSIYIDVPFPKAFTTARAAGVGILNTAKRNKISGLRGYGNGNTGAQSDLVQHYYTDNFVMDDCVGYDLPGAVRYAGDYHYGTRVSNCYAYRCGNAVGIHSQEDVRGTRCTYSNINDSDCLWGQEYKGSVYSNGSGLSSGFAANRALKFHHNLHCNWTNLTGINGYGRSGITVSGDSNWNNFSSFQVEGNYENGVLITQIPAGTNVVQRNRFSNFVARNNGWGGSAVDVFIATPLGAYNDFFQPNTIGAIYNTATGNVFDTRSIIRTMAAPYSTNTGATYTDVTGLDFDLGAGETWEFDGWLMCDGLAAADITVGMIGPAGCNGFFSMQGSDGAGAMFLSGTLNFAATVIGASIPCNGAFFYTGIHIRGTVTGPTAGKVKLQARQTTANATVSHIYAQSWLRAQRAFSHL